jgi:hypothetical protein
MTDVPDDWIEPLVMSNFNEHRGHAIGIYSNLEQALCESLSYFGEMSNEVAGTVFFKINNARGISEILDKLKKRRIGNKHNFFWNSLLKSFRRLAERRNQIVHWITAIVIQDDQAQQEIIRYPILTPPNFWVWKDGETPELEIHKIDEFSRECGRTKLALVMFLKSLRGPWSEEEEKTWRETFQQPLIYPPQSGSPLFPNPIEL